MALAFAFQTHLVLCLIAEIQTAASEQAAKRAPDGVESPPVYRLADSSALDAVSIHMYKLYDKYSRGLNRPRDGNTVRSFKATTEIVNQNVLYHFNLTSMRDSEVILAATFHSPWAERTRQRHRLCRQLRRASCPSLRLSQLPSLRLLFRGASGAPLGNVTVSPHRRGDWQVTDVTRVIQDTWSDASRCLSVTVESEFDGEYQRSVGQLSPRSLPYVLVYADDPSVSEPNSIAATLQRYDPATPSANSSPGARVKRDTVQNNELPDAEYHTSKARKLWADTYLPLKPKLPRKERRQKGRGSAGRSQILRFDEATVEDARRGQQDTPPVCSRRYLKVDFADVGWSEWVILPKSFDAFYCAGTCEFPMSKAVRPSNHATLQSIARAVGVVPGVPRPCCVPDETRPLSVLFLDESGNAALKIYPSMSVETCACR